MVLQIIIPQCQLKIFMSLPKFQPPLFSPSSSACMCRSFPNTLFKLT